MEPKKFDIEMQAGTSATLGNHNIEQIKDFWNNHLPTAEKRMLEICKQHNVHLKNIGCHIGSYKGALEPPLIVELSGEMRNILGTLAHWGKCHNQESIRIIYVPQAKDGSQLGLRHVFTLSKPIEDLEKLASLLNLHEISVTAFLDENKNVTHLEYWGHVSPSSDKDVALIQSFLESVYGANIIADYSPKPGYTILDIPNENFSYDDYILASLSNQAIEVKLGECLSDYEKDSGN